MYERVCVNCREAFTPLEGNDTRDFCSDDCEIDYHDDWEYAEYTAEDFTALEYEESDDYTEVMLQDYGKEN